MLHSPEATFCVKVDDSGSYAMVGGGDGINIYNIKESKLKKISVLKNNSIPILDMTLSPTHLVSSNKAGHLVEWDLEKGKKTLKLYHSHGPLRSVERIDNNIIISGGDDSHVKVWDVRSMKCVQEFKDHKDSISSVKWKEFQIISSSLDSSVRSWDIRSGLLREDCYPSPCSSLILLPNTYCVSLLEDKMVIPPPPLQQRWTELKGHVNRNIFLKSAYVPRSGNIDLIASGSEDSSLHVWEWTGQIKQKIETESIPSSLIYNEKTISLITLSINGILTKYSHS